MFPSGERWLRGTLKPQSTAEIRALRNGDTSGARPPALWAAPDTCGLTLVRLAVGTLLLQGQAC